MTDYTAPAEWENKAARPGASGIGESYDDFLSAFEAFKDTNDRRLGEIERRMSADVVTTEKLDRINRALDDYKSTVDQLVLKASRPQRGGGAAWSGVTAEHKAAFETYMRRGEAQNLRRLEEKSLSASVDADGGYLVPEEIEAGVMRALRDASPIRAISGIRQVSRNVYKKPFAITGAATGWVAETGTRAQTNAPTLAELAFPTMELYAMPAATQTLLEDAAVNIDEWVAEEVRIAFAEQENLAFVSGDGTNKPKGFLSYTKIAESSWAWDKIGYILTGADGGFAAGSAADTLIDLVYTLKSAYRANAHWVMNRSTQAEIRKIKDDDGNYIWRPGEQAGQGATLMTFPIAETEDMPAIAADSYSIAFGDFGRGYLVVDRIGIRILRDPFSSKPYVLFYTTKRVGGGVQDFNAIKLLKFADA
ncbi:MULTISPECIES: phage major capsid protein [Rhodomicrobium]|uniref:phage major capsid protein n=1 Tax=Rhodomicrobium TaxID=1068 RepID=UPI000B4A8B19|nr:MULTISPECIES: phage major capsid protein [Rhodomicrobium]